MTQRIFDVENEKDMADLWDIVPDNTEKIKKSTDSRYFDRLYRGNGDILVVCFLKINWHDKTEITRPIEEATEEDIDKLCVFWNNGDEEEKDFGFLAEIYGSERPYRLGTNLADLWYDHCRRLTKQEIEEIC